MTCKEYRVAYIGLMEEGLKEPLPVHLMMHKKTCAACTAFSAELDRQYTILHAIKQQEANPYLAAKVFQKMKEKKNVPALQYQWTRKIVLTTAVVCLGFFTGLALDMFFSVPPDQPEEVAAAEDVSITSLEEEDTILLTQNE